MGPPKKDYEKVAPPNSFIHIDDFETPEKLGQYLNILHNNKTEYFKYLEWKEDYEVECEEKWSCQLCKKLHQPDNFAKQRKIENFSEVWNRKHCYGDWHYQTYSNQ